ncbi:MAG: hypothetical protein ACK5N8_08775 [Alphaproteobacteria bacterium]
MENIIFSTFRHPEYFDNSRILVGQITEDILSKMRPNDKISPFYYELTGINKGITGKIDLSPFCQYQSNFTPKLSIIPWWEKAEKLSLQKHVYPFLLWLKKTLYKLQHQTNNPKIREYALKLSSLVSETYRTAEEQENIGSVIANLSHKMVSDILEKKFKPIPSYANSDVNKEFLSLTMKHLNNPNFINYISRFSSRTGDLDWSFVKSASISSIHRIGFRKNKIEQKEIDIYTGKPLKEKFFLTNKDLYKMIYSSMESKTEQIIAIGYYTDILRGCVFPQKKIFTLEMIEVE